MSTDLRGFWRLGIAVCCVLALVAAVLGGVGLVRGPALAGATIAADRAVTSAGTRLVLRARQPLAEVAASQVSVTPAVPVTVTTRDDSVWVRFTGPLAYGTDYAVTVTAVRSQYTGRTADWSYHFATPAATLYSLVAHRTQGDTRKDTIEAAGASGQRAVLEAEGIQDYAVTGSQVVAISSPDDKTGTLVAVDRAGGRALDVRAPQGTALALLQASGDGNRFGYTVTGRDSSGTSYNNVLYLQDATDLTKDPVAVMNSGKPIAVQDWRFVPGVAAVVALALDGQAYLAYLDSEATPVPLGSLAQLIGFLPGSTTLVAETGGKEVLFDLSAGHTTRASAVTSGAKNEVVGRTTLLGPDDYLAEKDEVKRSAGRQEIVTHLTHVSGGNQVVLTSITAQQGQSLDSGISPNGEFAWVEVLAAGAPVEELTSGASDHATTLVFDLASGRQVATLTGATPIWAVG